MKNADLQKCNWSCLNGVRNLPTMTSLQLRFVYQQQAVFLNLHYVAET